MNDLSLYIMDIVQNSISANALNIIISITMDKENFLELKISDDGKGMDALTLANIKNPFQTSRTTRKVGLGIPFLTMAAEQTGGFVKINSRHIIENKENHGTDVLAVFNTNHIDSPPLGDIAETISLLIFSNPNIDFIFKYHISKKNIELETKILKDELQDIPLNTPEVYIWIKEYLYSQLNGS